MLYAFRLYHLHATCMTRLDLHGAHYEHARHKIPCCAIFLHYLLRI